MKYQNVTFTLLIIVILLASCAPVESETVPPEATQSSGLALNTEVPDATPTEINGISMDPNSFANVLSIQVSGELGAYQFAVEVTSPDTGCDQFADWWEVVSEDGQLLYRRILLHSHVDEQPFTRPGGPVRVDADTIVYVRAHMNTTGYGGTVMKGTVRDGFEAVVVEAGFGSELERILPQPEDCAF